MHTALNGWGYTQQYYAYEPVQADGILAQYLGKLAAGSLTPAQAMKEAAQQVNALEAVGPRIAAAFAAEEDREQRELQTVKVAPSCSTALTTLVGRHKMGLWKGNVCSRQDKRRSG